VQADEHLIDANTAFGLDMLKDLGAQEKGKNLFISPLSAHVLLSMVANGAAGDTRAEMARTLHTEGMREEEANRAVQALLQGLNAAGVGRPDVSLANQMATAVAGGDDSGKDPLALYTANGIWAKEGVPFTEDFLARNRTFFNAQIETADFSQATVNRVNDWVSGNTNGKINRILDGFPPNAVMLLVNTLYFKAPWAAQFNEEQTRAKAFHLADGRTVQAPTMHQNWKHQYVKGPDFAAVKLPYAGYRTSMYVFLPDAGVALDAWVQRLDAAAWDRWMAEFKEGGGNIALPKFAFSYETVLNDTLQRLGTRLAFGGGDFTRMSPANPYLSEVRQKTVVDVNEKGTEAAAVTSAMMAVSGPAFTFDFIADRPFLFAIRDDETGALLFLGTVYDPLATGE
jgi:serpin B